MKKHAGNGVKYRGNPKQQLLDNIVKNEITGCWLWQAGKFSQSGYGQFNNKLISKSPTTAHKAAWIIFKGQVPEKMMVLHKCDNRQCCNPEHLYIGNNSDNMIDRSKRGYVHQRKLDENKVREIRQLRQNGWSWGNLAKRYGVNKSAVFQAGMGLSWSFIDEPIPTVIIPCGRRPGS